MGFSSWRGWDSGNLASEPGWAFGGPSFSAPRSGAGACSRQESPEQWQPSGYVSFFGGDAADA